jgi:hypothetical protein
MRPLFFIKLRVLFFWLKTYFLTYFLLKISRKYPKHLDKSIHDHKNTKKIDDQIKNLEKCNYLTVKKASVWYN